MSQASDKNCQEPSDFGPWTWRFYGGADSDAEARLRFQAENPDPRQWNWHIWDSGPWAGERWDSNTQAAYEQICKMDAQQIRRKEIQDRKDKERRGYARLNAGGKVEIDDGKYRIETYFRFLDKFDWDDNFFRTEAPNDEFWSDKHQKVWEKLAGEMEQRKERFLKHRKARTDQLARRFRAWDRMEAGLPIFTDEEEAEADRKMDIWLAEKEAERAERKRRGERGIDMSVAFSFQIIQRVRARSI